jgi:hypothetical protein
MGTLTSYDGVKLQSRKTVSGSATPLCKLAKPLQADEQGFRGRPAGDVTGQPGETPRKRDVDPMFEGLEQMPMTGGK